MTAERLPWISADPASQRLLELAQKVAVAPATLLITGESGSGKDHLARLIALTNVDLPAAVKSGSFREDLYFRLNVLCLAVPPLRGRRADILPLADHLLATFRSVHSRPNAQLSDSVSRMLTAYTWPGN